jgi:hypothetical protein
MHRLIRANALLVLAFLFVTGCELLDPPEPAPAYLRLVNPRVELDSVNQFYSNIGIRNVWLYHGGNFQGLYNVLPDSEVVIPVIDLERSDFIMEGGIYETGQSAFHLPYGFWKRENFNLDLTPLDTFTIDLRFEYVEDRFYDLRVNESFEGNSVDFVPFSLALNEPGGTFMALRSDAPFQGTGYAHVNFGPGDRYFQAINSSPFSLTRGKQVYGEITYRNSIPLTVALLFQNAAGLSSRDVVTLSATNTWNTVYVHFVDLVREIVNTGGENTAFWLYLKADSEDKEGFIALDDVRLITER